MGLFCSDVMLLLVGGVERRARTGLERLECLMSLRDIEHHFGLARATCSYTTQQEGNGERLAISAWYNFTWVTVTGGGGLLAWCHALPPSLPPSSPVSHITPIQRTSVTNDVQM